jgi:hypothetical protein
MKIFTGSSVLHQRQDISWMFIRIEASPAMSMTRAVAMRDLHTDRQAGKP